MAFAQPRMKVPLDGGFVATEDCRLMRAGKYLALVTIFNLTLAAGSNLGSWPLHHRYQTPSLLWTSNNG